MKYIANIEIDNQLEKIEFETEDNPVSYLWAKYGMSSYIEKIEEVDDDDIS